jgi:AcrR family transcriptional regulator
VCNVTSYLLHRGTTDGMADRQPLARPAGDSNVFDLPALLTGLDGPPPPELDPFLDAAARCFARYGIRRTSVQDVARELGVDRTTIYRQLGTIDQQARLLAAREIHRLLLTLPARTPPPVSAQSVIETMASVIDDIRTHPVMAKVLADDTNTIPLSSLAILPPLLAHVTAVLAPMLRLAMDIGALAPRDPTILAEWLIRLVVTLVLVPPLGDLRAFLSEVLLPALTP